MKAFILNSIDPKQVDNNLEDILKDLQLCSICGNLPIPSYRSYKMRNNYYCKTCFDSLNAKPKHLIEPSPLEYRLLEKIFIKCKNFDNDCDQKFTVDTLSELLDHQNNCMKSKNIYFNTSSYCIKCKMIISNVKTHDCLTSIINQNIINLEIINKKHENEIKDVKENLQNEFQREINNQKQDMINENIKLRSLVNDLQKQIDQLRLITHEKFENMTDISNVHQGLLDYIERDLRLLTLKHNEKSINPFQISKNQLPVITPNPINQLPVITPNPINQLPVITPNPYLNKTILESNLPKKELERKPP